MNEVICQIEELKVIEEKEFYVIREIETNLKHFIPKLQIETFKSLEISQKYSFNKEFNKDHNKVYFSIINPSYQIGKVVEFKVINSSVVDDKLYFELDSDFNDSLTVSGYKWQQGLEKIKCKIVGYKRGKAILKNVDTSNSEWSIGEIQYFRIGGYGQFVDKKGDLNNCINIKINSSTEIAVKCEKWHLPHLWKFKEIKCKVIGIDANGLPRLIVFDDRHPIYKIGAAYKFKVEGFQEKLSYKGYPFKVIKLSDFNDDYFEVLCLPNQENKLKINDEIECEIVNVDTRIHLRQVKVKDAFFHSYEEIVNNSEYKNKYFINYLNDKNEHNLKLKNQYEQQSAFWVFTYCNHILTKIKAEECYRKNLVEVKSVIELHLNFEKWILTSGILKAIINNDERKLTKLKTSQIIQNLEAELFSINSIVNFKEKEFFESQIQKKNFREIYYFIIHSNFSEINEISFMESLFRINKIDDTGDHFVKKIIYYIRTSLDLFKSSLQQEYFILSQNIDVNQKNNIKKNVNWIFIQLLLSEYVGLREEKNILLSKFYRFNTYLSNNKINNQKLLLNAFYVISNTDRFFEIPVEITSNDVNILIDKLDDNPNQGNNLDTTKEFYFSNVKEKHYNGYKLFIDDTPGFLPTQNITDLSLKYFNALKVQWETNIAITLYSSEFRYFIGKQLNTDSENFLSINKTVINVKNGDIIYAIVKDTKVFESNSFGVFVSTEYGDGLIHEKYISTTYFDKNELQMFFNIGDKIPVYVLEYKNNKLNLSLIHLKGTSYEKQYNKIFSFYDIDNYHDISDEEVNYSFRIELEKGYIFEQFALFQNSIEEKIKFIKFSKAFFSNTKNARSYLLNIYIEYFNSLQKLDELISNYSYKKYYDFKDYIIQIREKIQLQTLENFPESKNLIFFIDILYYFNSKSEDDLQVLFDLTRKPILENDISLKAVAKTVLSNNLIISEINEADDESLDYFTLKNLKRIREYISQGVLSVKDSFEDKLAKELNEKRIYWLKMINEDEGEKLEFKATFITPVPNNEKNRIIESLRNELDKQTSEESVQKINDKIKDIEDQSKKKRGIDKIIIHSALKTICAFANTNGGYLILGVSDDKKIFGLEQDYNSFKTDKNRDGFGKYFDAMLKDYFGESFSSSLLEKEFLKFPEGDILIVKVNKSLEEIFLLKNEEGLQEENIYVRNLSSSVKLKGIELSKFLKRRYREFINNIEVKQ